MYDQDSTHGGRRWAVHSDTPPTTTVGKHGKLSIFTLSNGCILVQILQCFEILMIFDLSSTHFPTLARYLTKMHTSIIKNMKIFQQG